jgi:hypothetical protein
MNQMQRNETKVTAAAAAFTYLLIILLSADATEDRGSPWRSRHSFSRKRNLKKDLYGDSNET